MKSLCSADLTSLGDIRSLVETGTYRRGGYSIAPQTTANLRSVSTCAPPCCSIASPHCKFAAQEVKEGF